MTIVSRSYAGDEDYERLRRFLDALQPLVGSRVYATAGELDWWRWTDDDPDAIRHARLWFAERDDLVGFAWPAEEQVDIVVHPDHRALDEAMLAWSEEYRRGTDRTATTKSAWAFESDEARQDILRRRGHEATDYTLNLNRQELTGSVPAPHLPPGYAIRHVAGEADLERRVAVHRNAFAPSKMTVVKHRAVLAAPSYRPDLDLVVVAPDGSFAAFCIVWLDETNRVGVFEPVGTHSAHRRLGLGTALLREGMGRIWDRGARSAYVTSRGSSEAANALYTSAGFAPVDRNRAWKKTL